MFDRRRLRCFILYDEEIPPPRAFSCQISFNYHLIPHLPPPNQISYPSIHLPQHDPPPSAQKHSRYQRATTISLQDSFVTKIKSSQPQAATIMPPNYVRVLADLPVTGVRLVVTFSPSLVSTIHDLSYKNQAAAPNFLAPLSNFPTPYVTRPSAVPYHHPIAARANQHERVGFCCGILRCLLFSKKKTNDPVLDFWFITTTTTLILAREAIYITPGFISSSFMRWCGSQPCHPGGVVSVCLVLHRWHEPTVALWIDCLTRRLPYAVPRVWWVSVVMLSPVFIYRSYCSNK